jgi:hypothetical protein
MYDSIRRYQSCAASLDDMTIAANRLGSALSHTPGFVAAFALEQHGAAFVTISLFDDEAGLAAGNALAEGWTREHLDRFGLGEVITGEVVAQKGL